MSTGSNSTFKILSIDGGGIRGLYSAQLLAVLEKRVSGRLVDYFDMICGTSTGGLIALGLAIGIPASTIADFYFEKGPQIFPARYRWIRLLSQLLGRGKYSNAALKYALTSVLG